MVSRVGFDQFTVWVQTLKFGLRTATANKQSMIARWSDDSEVAEE